MRGKSQDTKKGRETPEPEKTTLKQKWKNLKKPHLFVYWSIVVLVGIAMLFHPNSRVIAPFVIGFSLARMAQEERWIG